MPFNNLIGQKFGKLTVIGRAENSKNGKAKWLCRCDCGKLKQKNVTTNDLKSGKVKSCGCLYFESNKERNKTHGFTHTRLYNIRNSMIQRCTNPKNKSYDTYGARGITVCDEWRNSFDKFREWALAKGYADNLSIDRIDNSGSYEPSNCRWVDMKTQENNRSNNRIIDYYGTKYTVAELSELLSISYATLLNRINSGWKECELKITPNLKNKKIRRML